MVPTCGIERLPRMDRVDPSRPWRTWYPWESVSHPSRGCFRLVAIIVSCSHYSFVLSSVNFSVLAIACWQAFEARDIQCEFAEAKYIALAVFSLSQGFLTGIPIVAVAKDIPEAFYMILTFLLFVVCMTVLLLIFLPKMLVQRRYGRMTPDEQKKAMAVSVRLSSRLNESNISGLASSAFRQNHQPVIKEDEEYDEEDDSTTQNNSSTATTTNPPKDPSNRSTTTVETSRGGATISTISATNKSMEEMAEESRTPAADDGTDKEDLGPYVTRGDKGRRLYSSYIDSETIDA